MCSQQPPGLLAAWESSGQCLGIGSVSEEGTMKDSELRILCLSICLISQMGLLRPREEGLP